MLHRRRFSTGSRVETASPSRTEKMQIATCALCQSVLPSQGLCRRKSELSGKQVPDPSDPAQRDRAMPSSGMLPDGHLLCGTW